MATSLTKTHLIHRTTTPQNKNYLIFIYTVTTLFITKNDINKKIFQKIYINSTVNYVTMML